MQTPCRKPHRRSWEELRLEQIAIWGDAAYNTRHTTPTEAKSEKNALDIDALEEAVIAEGMEIIPRITTSNPRGSFSMCHSRSAEVFRRSGTHAAVARASFRDRRRSRLPDVEEGDFQHVVAAKRSSLSLAGREYWMDAARVAGRRGKFEEWDEDLVLQTRRESAFMRERDECNFRASNAKLPERVDDDSSGHLHLRRARASMTMLGRYSRTRSSQLPPRARTVSTR